MSLDSSQTLTISGEDPSRNHSSSSSSSRAPWEEARAGLKPCTPTRKPKPVSTPPQPLPCSIYQQARHSRVFFFLHFLPLRSCYIYLDCLKPEAACWPQNSASDSQNRKFCGRVKLDLCGSGFRAAGSSSNEEHRKDRCFGSAVRAPLKTTAQLDGLLRATSDSLMAAGQ